MMKSKMVFGFVVAFAMAVAPQAEGMKRKSQPRRGTCCFVPRKKVLIAAAVLVAAGAALDCAFTGGNGMAALAQGLFTTKEAALEFLKANAPEVVTEKAGELALVVSNWTPDMVSCLWGSMTNWTNVMCAGLCNVLGSWWRGNQTVGLGVDAAESDFAHDQNGNCVGLQSDSSTITENELTATENAAAQRHKEADNSNFMCTPNSCSRTPTDEQIEDFYAGIDFEVKKCLEVDTLNDAAALRDDPCIDDVDRGDTDLDLVKCGVQCEEGPSGDVACKYYCRLMLEKFWGCQEGQAYVATANGSEGCLWFHLKDL